MLFVNIKKKNDYFSENSHRSSRNHYTFNIEINLIKASTFHPSKNGRSKNYSLVMALVVITSIYS